MPTYFVTTAVGRLSVTQKRDIAAAITHIHNDVTDAPAFFAQVIFGEVGAGNHFIGGVRASADVVFVYGHIRAGRGPDQKRQLLVRIVAAVGAAALIPNRFIWAYLADLPSTQMAEYGHILPEPGMEKAWLDGLPETDRAYMQRVGKE